MYGGALISGFVNILVYLKFWNRLIDFFKVEILEINRRFYTTFEFQYYW